MFGANTSVAGLNEITSIQTSGKTVISASSAETSIQMSLTSCACGLVMVEPAAARHGKEEERGEHQHDDEQRRHRRGVAEGAELEGLLVDVDDQRRGGVHRTALG